MGKNLKHSLLINTIFVILAIIYYSDNKSQFSAFYLIPLFIFLVYFVALFHSFLFDNLILKIKFLLLDTLSIPLLIIYFTLKDYVNNKFNFYYHSKIVILFYVIPILISVFTSLVMRKSEETKNFLKKIKKKKKKKIF